MLVEIESRDATRVMTMQSGQDNRFNSDFVAALNGALDEIEADQDAHALVVTAAQEKYFSNGIDIEWVAASGPEIMKVFFPNFLRMLARFLTFEKPVVAAINGHAFAGGFFFAMTAAGAAPTRSIWACPSPGAFWHCPFMLWAIGSLKGS